MKIAIVGSAPSSEHLAPFDDSEWQIWALAWRYSHYPRADRLFEVHTSADWLTEEYARGLIETGLPVVTGERFPVYGSEVFPFEKAREIFGTLYLTSSVAYMMAYAILQGADEIGIYGVDMSVADKEYFHQQPCMTALIGYAMGMGIRVTIPDESSLMKSTYIYGVQDRKDAVRAPFTQDDFLALERQHQEAMDSLQEQIQSIQAKIHSHNGARQAYERMAKVARSIEAGQDIKSLEHTAHIRP